MRRTCSTSGINYRAEVWLNGHRIADSTRIVGMHGAHQIDATPWINQGGPNILAVKVTPERALQDVDGVELADSWYDWINWRYLGHRSPVGAVNNSFVADRNAGIWKPVYLRMSEDVVLGPGAVNTELPWPSTDSALLTVYTGVRNYSGEVVRGIIRATITRPGKPDIRLDKRVTLAAGEEREIVLGPGERLVELAGELGIPLMLGWMCCKPVGEMGRSGTQRTPDCT